MGAAGARPKLAVWKFASCDGCQLSLLDLEDELLTLAEEIEIAYFLEASRATVEGPYDLSLVEGSVTTPADAERILEVRRASRRLVTIGACATAGGIQALRNLEVIAAFLAERRPAIPSYSVCMECKRRGNVCVMVAHGTPCLGPVTHAGCGALCPAHDRGCYGCFGPMETPNTASLSGWMRGLGAETPDLVRVYRNFNANAPAFRAASEASEQDR
jgi:coenzyme F420-reducing hydrogenase gamma subunit